MESQNKHIAKNDLEVAIDLSVFLKSLKKHRLLIIVIALLFGITGAVIGLLTPNEFVSEVKLLPELESKDGVGGLGKFKSLAGLAGIDLGSMSSSEAIRPDLYPNIIQSTPFMLEALKKKIFIKKSRNYQSIYEYLRHQRENTLYYKILGDSDDGYENNQTLQQSITSGALSLNKKETIIIKELQKRIGAAIDKKSGVISISAKMTDPIAAANLATFAQEYLTRYITNYRTEKTRKEITFLENRVSDAKKRYDGSLFNLSNYQDKNRGLFLNVAKDQEKKLQYDVDLSFNLYSELSRQLEEAKVKIQKEAPVFKVLEPAQIPLKKSEPKRSVMVIGFILLGAFLATIYVFFKSINFSSILK